MNIPALAINMNDILDDSYESDLTEAESTELLLMCGHAVAPPISPAAQAVMDAVRVVPILLNDQQERIAIAAALRAVVKQLATYAGVQDGYQRHLIDADALLAIADELEQQP